MKLPRTVIFGDFLLIFRLLIRGVLISDIYIFGNIFLDFQDVDYFCNFDLLNFDFCNLDFCNFYFSHFFNFDFKMLIFVISE